MCSAGPPITLKSERLIEGKTDKQSEWMFAELIILISKASTVSEVFLSIIWNAFLLNFEHYFKRQS